MTARRRGDPWGSEVTARRRGDPRGSGSVSRERWPYPGRAENAGSRGAGRTRRPPAVRTAQAGADPGRTRRSSGTWSPHQALHPRPAQPGTTRRRPSPRTWCRSRPATGCSSAVNSPRPPTAVISAPLTRPPRSPWPRWRRRGRLTWTGRSRRPGTPMPGPGARCRAGTGPSTCTGSPGSSRSGPASSPCWRAWTTASRSRNRGTWTYRWPPRTSSTTRAGRTSWGTPGSARIPARSAWPGRSSRGTSRC